MTATEAAVLRVMSEETTINVSTIVMRINGDGLSRRKQMRLHRETFGTLCDMLKSGEIVTISIPGSFGWLRTSAGTAALAKWDAAR